MWAVQQGCHPPSFLPRIASFAPAFTFPADASDPSLDQHRTELGTGLLRLRALRNLKTPEEMALQPCVRHLTFLGSTAQEARQADPSKCPG